MLATFSNQYNNLRIRFKNTETFWEKNSRLWFRLRKKKKRFYVILQNKAEARFKFERS